MQSLPLDDSMELEESYAAADAPGIQLNNSFDASMLHSSESDTNKLALRQVASWDASRPSDQELPPVYSASKSAARPRHRPPTTAVKKSRTPASVKRQRTAQRKSPRHRSDLLILDKPSNLNEPIIVKKRAPKDSLGTHTTAASSTLLDETIDSADDSSLAAAAASGGARFRFTSFPASLPRLSQPGSSEQQLVLDGGPESIRKRMSFGGLSFLNQQQPLSTNTTDDFTNNTSLSSVGYDSDHSNHGRRGDEEDSNCSSLLGTPVHRTRLNFNGMLSPSMRSNIGTDAHQQQPLIHELRRYKEPPLLPADDSQDQCENNQANIFARSFTSGAHRSHDKDGCVAEHPSGVTRTTIPSRTNRDSLFGLESNRPRTPREVQLHFQLDSTQCSPIPGIPEEDGDLSCGSAAFSPRSSRNDALLSTSHDSSSTGKKSARPMPDMHAFDGDVNLSRDHSTDGTLSSTNSRTQHPPSPRLLCPPTPMRTPAWAQSETIVRPVSKTGGHIKFGRANSLVTTKVLAVCEPQVLNGRVSVENASVEGDRSRDSVKSRELPPCIKKTNTQDSDEDTIDGSNDNSMECEEGDWLHDGSLHSAGVPSPSAEQQVKRRCEPAQEELPPVVSLAAHFEVLSSLGSGAFADVFRVRSKVDGGMYAVKRNRRHFRGRRDREKALAEVKCMQRLQASCSRNDTENVNFSLYILFFFQAWQEDCHFLVQTELCCRDTLADVLDSIRSKWTVAELRYPSLQRLTPLSTMPNESSFSSLDGRLLPEETIWKICHDVGAGLSHIHSRGLVHYDIKSSNIFFVAHARLGAICKIGDFGMAGEIGSSEDGQEGDQKYMAPEILVSEKKLPSADMFSFGLMLYELSAYPTFALPDEGPRWRDLRNCHFGAGDVPPCRTTELMALIKSTLQPNKENRPTADAVLALERVSAAGSTCEEFLRCYIADVEEFDRREEEHFSYRQEDKTPRTQKPQIRICSPTLNSFFVRDNVMKSPEAAHT